MTSQYDAEMGRTALTASTPGGFGHRILLFALATALVALLAAVLAGTAQAETRDPTQQPFSVHSPWNQPAGSGAQIQDAAGECTQDVADPTLVTDVNAAYYSHPVYVANENDPQTDLIVAGQTKATIPVPAEAEPSKPTFDENPDTDAHLHIIVPAKNGDRLVYEMWRAKRTAAGIEADSLSVNSLYGSGVEAGGERAYGGSALGGLIRTKELEQQLIPHALALAIPRSHLKLGPVWPAIYEDAGANGTYLGNVPMGTFAVIPPTVDIDSLGLSSDTARVIAHALQDYGAYIVDATRDDASFTADPSAEDLLGDFWADLTEVRSQLRCVVDNKPENVGGGGVLRAPLAPDLEAPTTPDPGPGPGPDPTPDPDPTPGPFPTPTPIPVPGGGPQPGDPPRPHPAPAAVKCKVPKLVGLRLANAKLKLQANHCKVGRVRKVRACVKRQPSKCSIVVTRQSAPNGNLLPDGTQISLWLAPREKHAR